MRTLSPLLALCLFAVVAWNAWAGDDVFITMRLVDRVLAGEGPSWNPGERVQVFTHPLWAAGLLGAQALVRDAFWAPVGLGLLTTAAALALVVRRAPGAAVALLLLLGSRAFVDYSTSGLENPLIHGLLWGMMLPAAVGAPGGAGTSAGLGGPSVVRVAGGVGLLLLTRLDLLPLLAPLVWVAWRGPPPALTRAGEAESARGPAVRSRGGRVLLLALGPSALLALLSTFVFGSPLPNAALAKLGAGLPHPVLWAQGLAYLAQSLRADPVTLGSITLGLIVGLRRGDRLERAAMVGVVLHLLWVVHAGGDFMAGRFLTPALALALTPLMRREARLGALWVLPLLALGLAVGRSAPWTPPDRHHEEQADAYIDGLGIADERAYYTPGSAVVGWRPGRSMPQHRFRQDGEGLAPDAVVLPKAVGMRGVFAAPTVWIVDRSGVADPFLARIPARPGSRRPGHYWREPPWGYVEGIQETRCALLDPKLDALCDDLRLVTRGPLGAPGRWDAIVRIAVGDLATVVVGRRPGLAEVDGDSVFGGVRAVQPVPEDVEEHAAEQDGQPAVGVRQVRGGAQPERQSQRGRPQEHEAPEQDDPDRRLLRADEDRDERDGVQRDRARD